MGFPASLYPDVECLCPCIVPLLSCDLWKLMHEFYLHQNRLVNQLVEILAEWRFSAGREQQDMIFPDLLISINAHVRAECRSQLIDLPTRDDFQINRKELGFGFNVCAELSGSLWPTGAFSRLDLTI